MITTDDDKFQQFMTTTDVNRCLQFVTTLTLIEFNSIDHFYLITDYDFPMCKFLHVSSFGNYVFIYLFINS